MADLEESLLAKRNKTEDATSDELGDESDDRLQPMTQAFRTIIEVRK